ncbi:C40 family peptidase [Polaromonas sp. P2-4]|nr:C40 family peptidase [Polaromonas sp. P2-4]
MPSPIVSMDFSTHTLGDPPRVELRSPQGRWLATLTHGAQTVTSAGPRRSFSESEVRVTHATWVRALPAPFDGHVDTAWLQQALDANAQRRPDLLAIGLQYLRGAPAQRQGGLQIAGDAAYGPLVDGKRQEGADFNDYLGVPWTYDDGTVDTPEPPQFRCLDCSGFVRMVWGYRWHAPGKAPALPLSLASSADGGTLPRRAFQMSRRAPGVLIERNRGVRLRDLSRLAIGDLVFFDADADDGPRIDHVGIYVGLGSDGLRRFLSSRKGANGPTMADVRGKSVLDGNGLYARSLRAVRRL